MYRRTCESWVEVENEYDKESEADPAKQRCSRQHSLGRFDRHGTTSINKGETQYITWNGRVRASTTREERVE